MNSLSTSNATGSFRTSESFTREEVRGAINFLRDLPRPELQKALAQVIAGAIADSEHIAMQQFASTGELNAEALLDELDRVEVAFEEEAWVDALARFVLFTSKGRS
ncbi:hypothetical protein [Actinomyces polynesiensis]|uniref:hypothetical protein n=1 Tax=Actinomyces polynesiensis TaxID=1325934 RepID=UPI0005B785A3|nr:hypothetical protein [Actinomyces polynesiensis]